MTKRDGDRGSAFRRSPKPSYLFSPSATFTSFPRLALLSLGHPLGADPAPCGNFAALLFRFLPQESFRATTTRLTALRASFLAAAFPKSADSPLGAGHSRELRNWCPE